MEQQLAEDIERILSIRSADDDVFEITLLGTESEEYVSVSSGDVVLQKVRTALGSAAFVEWRGDIVKDERLTFADLGIESGAQLTVAAHMEPVEMIKETLEPVLEEIYGHDAETRLAEVRVPEERMQAEAPWFSVLLTNCPRDRGIFRVGADSMTLPDRMTVNGEKQYLLKNVSGLNA